MLVGSNPPSSIATLNVANLTIIKESTMINSCGRKYGAQRSNIIAMYGRKGLNSKLTETITSDIRFNARLKLLKPLEIVSITSKGE